MISSWGSAISSPLTDTLFLQDGDTFRGGRINYVQDLLFRGNLPHSFSRVSRGNKVLRMATPSSPMSEPSISAVATH